MCGLVYGQAANLPHAEVHSMVQPSKAPTKGGNQYGSSSGQKNGIFRKIKLGEIGKLGKLHVKWKPHCWIGLNEGSAISTGRLVD